MGLMWRSSWLPQEAAIASAGTNPEVLSCAENDEFVVVRTAGLVSGGGYGELARFDQFLADAGAMNADVQGVWAFVDLG